jgi:cytochrome c1
VPPAFILFTLAAGSAAGVAIWDDNREVMHRAAGLTGGDPHAGEQALLRYGCGGCHTIPGVRRARGLVGPPLTAYGKRIYVAGTLYNSPDNLVRWIMDPQAIDPATAMPKVGVSEADARDIAAYLYTLR